MLARVRGCVDGLIMRAEPMVLAERSTTFELSVISYRFSGDLCVAAPRGNFSVREEARWRTILGQIDPGPAEEKIVAEKLPGSGTGRRLAAGAPGILGQLARRMQSG
jgi:hypothetical protein